MDQRPRVLLVDDDHDVLSLMEHILQEAGFDAELADSGRGAIQKIEAARPNLMTLDLVMPDVDGWGVLAHLRRIPAPPPVVVVTGHPESVGPFSMMASVTAYLVKPFSAADLVATCRKVATGRAPRPADVQDTRHEQRRMFVVEAKVLALAAGSRAEGHIVELSPRGLRLDVDLALAPGDAVQVTFRLPGYKDELRARGLVKWRHGIATGLELTDLEPDQAHRLQELMKPLGKPPVA
jgi:DNA-binding response OmpR family regulator